MREEIPAKFNSRPRLPLVILLAALFAAIAPSCILLDLAGLGSSGKSEANGVGGNDGARRDDPQILRDDDPSGAVTIPTPFGPVRAAGWSAFALLALGIAVRVAFWWWSARGGRGGAGGAGGGDGDGGGSGACVDLDEGSD